MVGDADEALVVATGVLVVDRGVLVVAVLDVLGALSPVGGDTEEEGCCCCCCCPAVGSSPKSSSDKVFIIFCPNMEIKETHAQTKNVDIMKSNQIK